MAIDARRLRIHYIVQRFALWFLMSYRGYSTHDRMQNECDLAMLGVLRWSMNPGGAHVGKFIAASVRYG